MINQEKSLTKINWDNEFHPSNVSVYVRNEIKINAAPDLVWAWLIRAKKWPEYYPNSKNVRVLNKDSNKLEMGSSFRWKTFGANLISSVIEYEKNKLIIWNARGFGIWVCHAWLIEKTSEWCFVTTEETQNGLLCILGNLIFPNRMYNFHQVWLEQLKIKAESGFPE